MTIEEEYELSCYEEIGILKEGKKAWLVRHVENGNLFVKKKIKKYNKELIFRLKELDIHDLPKIYLCVEDEDELTVIEEYIHGDTLYDIQKRDGLFDCENAVKIIGSLCDILTKLHSLTPPVIHRDIKPTNVMVSNDGIVKLIDFDAAKENTKGEKNDTYLMGTREYAAPEQYGFRQSDARTDIYAIGVMLNVMLTGCVPKENLYSGKVQKVIKKCTMMEPDERYKSVEELKYALELVVQNREYKNDGYTLVGYRTGKLWNGIAATAGYAFIMWIGLTIKFNNKDGTPFTRAATAYSRICVIAMMLGTVMFIGNYRGIRYRLPGMNKNPLIHWLLCAVYVIAYWFMILVVLAIMQMVFGT